MIGPSGETKSEIGTSTDPPTGPCTRILPRYDPIFNPCGLTITRSGAPVLIAAVPEPGVTVSQSLPACTVAVKASGPPVPALLTSSACSRTPVDALIATNLRYDGETTSCGGVRS